MEDISDITQEKRPEYLTFGVKLSSRQLLRPSAIALLVKISGNSEVFLKKLAK